MNQIASCDFIAPTTGTMCDGPRGVVTHQVILTGTGALTATVIHEGTNDQSGATGWTTIVTYTLSGSTEVSGSDVLEHSWLRLRSRCTALTGTNALARSIIAGVR